MNFIKRAWFAVIRKPGRTAILLIIFFAVANLVLAGISIQHATRDASVMARQKLGGTLTLSFNMQKAMEDAMSANSGSSGEGRRQFVITQTPLTEDIVNKVAKQKNILDYNIIVTTSGMAQNFTPVQMADDSSSSTPDDSQRQPSERANFQMPDVIITGLRSTELYSDFSDGSSKLNDGGAHITPDDYNKGVAIIENTLATTNNLKVGDTIKVSATKNTKARSLTIVGIFTASSDSSTRTDFGRGFNASFSQPYNKIYVDYGTALTLKGDAEADTSSSGAPSFMGGQAPAINSAVFYLDDPKNMDAAKADIAKMDIDWDKFTISTNDEAYNAMVGPIEKVASFATIAVVIVAVIGAVILALILLLNVKERMYETGVLLSMGESRLKLVLQYTAEMLIIAAVAFSVSFFSGGYIGQQIGNKLVASEISAEQNTVSTTQAGGPMQAGGPGGTLYNRLNRMRLLGGVNGNYKPISSISVKVTPIEVLQVVLAGLIIILFATIVPTVSIMRFKPRSILARAG